jgi:uncharacterized protein (DUF2235 family)
MRFNKQWRQDAHRILTIFGGLGMAEPEIATHRKRRLAVFLDGTWNAVDTNTNVWRMKSLCATKGTDDADQLIFYAKGVNGFWCRETSPVLKLAEAVFHRNYGITLLRDPAIRPAAV